MSTVPYLKLDHIDKNFTRGSTETEVLKDITLGIEKGPSFPAAVFAIPALALMGAVALAGFVKVYGIVFLATVCGAEWLQWFWGNQVSRRGTLPHVPQRRGTRQP